MYLVTSNLTVPDEQGGTMKIYRAFRGYRKHNNTWHNSLEIVRKVEDWDQEWIDAWHNWIAVRKYP